MARMFPKFFPASRSEPGSQERLAFDALARLPENVSVFYLPRVRKKNGFVLRPDFIVAVPDVGLVVLEAKSWPKILSSDGQKLLVQRADGKTFQAPHPLDQARAGMFALMDLLKNDGKLTSDNGRLPFPIISGVLWLWPESGGAAEIARALKEIDPTEIISRECADDPLRLFEAFRSIPRPFSGRISPEHMDVLVELLHTDISALEIFEAHRDGLIRIHRPLFSIAKALRDENGRSQLSRSVDQLQSGRFSIAVFGRFASGKSTLVNALVSGLDLPTHAVPTTAVVTRVRFGSERGATIAYRSAETIRALNKILPEGSQLDEAHPLVGSPPDRDGLIERAVARNVDAPYLQEVEVTVPSLTLAHGTDIVDLPGTDSTEPLHRLVAESYIPLADAVLFVVNASSPLGQSDEEILRSMQIAGRNIGTDRFVFFLNKLDEVKNRTAVESHVRTVLADKFGFTSPLIVSGCARLAELAGRSPLDPDQEKELRRLARKLDSKAVESERLREASGIPALRNALETLLAQRRGRLVLQAGVERVWKFHADSSLAIAPLCSRSRSEFSEISLKLEALEQRVRELDLPQARRALEKTRNTAGKRADVEVESVALLRESLSARTRASGLFADSANLNEQISADLRSWLAARRTACSELLADFSRRQERALSDLQRRMRTDVEEIVSPPDSIPINVEVGEIEWHGLDVPSVDVQTGIWTAIGTAAVMGAIPGSIFPGLGNLAGAVIGAALAGAGILATQVFAGKSRRTDAVDKVCEALRSRLKVTLDEQIETIGERHAQIIDRYEQDLSAVVLRIRSQFTGSAEEITLRIAEFEALEKELHSSRVDLDRFCVEAGLQTWDEYRRDSLLPVPVAFPGESGPSTDTSDNENTP